MKNNEYKIESKIVAVVIVFLAILAALLIVPLTFWQSEKARVAAEVKHNYFEGTVVASTCTASGYTAYECINDHCHNVKKEKFTAPLGHDIVTTVVEPTCYSEGYTLRTCRREGCNFEEKTNTVDMTEHSLGAPEIVEPTCTEAGYTVKKCTNDGCTYEERTDSVDKLGHNYSDHVCTRCETLDPDAPATGGLQYTLVESNSVSSYVVSGIGTAQISKYIKIADKYNDKAVTGIADGVFANKTDVKVVVLPSTVTTIGDGAFKGCTSLKTINLPSALKRIGEEAFSGCTSYAPTTIPSSVEMIGFSAFEGCPIESLSLPYAAGHEIPAGEEPEIEYLHFGYIFGATSYADNAVKVPSTLKTVTVIGSLDIVENAFYGCTSLTEVTVSDSVQLIGASAFEGCSNIEAMSAPQVAGDKHVEVADATTTVTYEYKHFGYAFGAATVDQNGAKLPPLKSLTVTGSQAVKDEAFKGLTSLEELVFSGSLTVIGDDAFNGCTALASVSFGNIKEIGESAFSGCSLLTDVVLPNALTTIGDYAFYGCALYEPSVIPATVTRIGLSAFEGCAPVESMSLPYAAGKLVIDGEATAIEYMHFGYIFGAATHADNATKIPSELKKVTVVGNLAIVDNAFNGVVSLETVTSSNTVTKIGASAFEGCAALASVTFGNGLKDIGESAFKGCTALKTVTIPNNVTDIGLSAFESCPLERISTPYAVGKVGSKYSYFGYMFGAESYSQNGAKVPTSLKTVIITGSLDVVDNAFNGCTAIERIKTDGSVKNVGTHAFMGCTALEAAALGTGLKTIGSGAFDGCTALKTVTLGKGIKIIGVGAFNGCAAIETVHYNGSIAQFGLTEYVDENSTPLVSKPDFYVKEDFVQYR